MNITITIQKSSQLNSLKFNIEKYPIPLCIEYDSKDLSF